MTPEEEYKLLFQTETCDWPKCEKVADGHVTIYCQEHEQQFLKNAADSARVKRPQNRTSGQPQ
jgi:hypothetical protein